MKNSAKIQAFEEIIRVCSAGKPEELFEVPVKTVDCAFSSSQWPPNMCFILMALFNDNIAMALALHKRILPDWYWEACPDEVSVFSPTTGMKYTGESKNPSIAWFLAILYAYLDIDCEPEIQNADGF